MKHNPYSIGDYSGAMVAGPLHLRSSRLYHMSKNAAVFKEISSKGHWRVVCRIVKHNPHIIGDYSDAMVAGPLHLRSSQLHHMSKNAAVFKEISSKAHWRASSLVQEMYWLNSWYLWYYYAIAPSRQEGRVVIKYFCSDASIFEQYDNASNRITG